MAVGEVKTHFSEILKEVKNGKKVGILYGKTKKPIAMRGCSKTSVLEQPRFF
jgi:antitoxin (DNA-binding transcriptional repressor) of toxin-antitoxin stability system